MTSSLALPTYKQHNTTVTVFPPGTQHSKIVSRTLQQEQYNGNDLANRFFLVDLGLLREQFQQFVTLLPRVIPYYAIKCNPNDLMISLLNELGAGFDCASLGEIEQVLALGVAPEKIIFANPCKFAAHILAAKNKGVHLMTADNVDEIHKIAKINPCAKIVLRVVTDDRKAKLGFSSKFGARQNTWLEILETIKNNHLDFVGASFHVGTGSSDLEVHAATLASVKELFAMGKALGFKPNFLDIGGGFPGEQKWKPSFPELAVEIRKALDQYFPETDIKIIAEPGRYFATRTHTLVTRIIARRFSENNQTGNVLYYLDEGYYQSFNCIQNDDYVPEFVVFPKNGGIIDAQFEDDFNNKRKKYKSTIFGPTCDSLDVMYKNIDLPLLEVGEWLVCENMGAYTCSSSAAFNGFLCKDFVYVDTNAFCCDVSPKLISAITTTASPPLLPFHNHQAEKKQFKVHFDDDELSPFDSERDLAKPSFDNDILFLSGNEEEN